MGKPAEVMLILMWKSGKEWWRMWYLSFPVEIMNNREKERSWMLMVAAEWQLSLFFICFLKAISEGFYRKV